MRATVIKALPEPPEPGSRPTEPAAISAQMARLDALYAHDAYNALTIAQYHVTPEMVDAVRSEAWSPDAILAPDQQRDALAARGYWLAFQRVKASVVRMLNGEDAVDVIEQDLDGWFRAMFGPSLDAGVLDPTDYDGYRPDIVLLRHRPVPEPLYGGVRMDMSVMFDYLRNEKHPAARALIAHCAVDCIGPYTDGIRRLGCLVMNALLVAGGYPWTVIPVASGETYQRALQSASGFGLTAPRDITPFTVLVATSMGNPMGAGLEGQSF